MNFLLNLQHINTLYFHNFGFPVEITQSFKMMMMTTNLICFQSLTSFFSLNYRINMLLWRPLSWDKCTKWNMWSERWWTMFLSCRGSVWWLNGFIWARIFLWMYISRSSWCFTSGKIESLKLKMFKINLKFSSTVQCRKVCTNSWK